MGIARMKKLTLLAEQKEKDNVLLAMQEMHNIEVISLREVLEKDEVPLLDGLHFEESKETVGQLTQNLQDIRYAISFLDQYVPKASLFKSMQKKRPVYSLADLEVKVAEKDFKTLLHRVDYMEQTLLSLEEDLNELKKEEEFFRQWQHLEFMPSETTALPHFNIQVGTIENERAQLFEDRLNELDSAYAEDIYQSRDTWGFLVVVRADEVDESKEILQQNGFQPLKYSYSDLPKEELKANLAKQKQILEKIAEEKESLKFYRDTRDHLRLTEEYFYNKREREKAKELMVNHEFVFVISGWTEADKIDSHIEHIEQNCDNQAIAFFQFDVEDEEIDDVPTVLNNPALVKPFESITSQFGLPKYDGFDPTPWYYPFHIAFFGMMSADLGYGLLLWLATWYALKYFELSKGMKSSLQLFNQLSYGTMAFGLVFGSFMGLDLPFRVMNLTDNVITVMGISVALGIIHMLLGYGIKIYLAMKEKDYVSAYLDGAQWALILLGISVIGLNMVFFNIDWLTTAGIVLILGNVLGMFLVKIFSNKNKLAGVGQAAFGIMDIASMVGDLVSYTRLTALAVSGANIGMAFNLILGLLPPLARFSIGVILFVLLHALNIFITYLGAYVHTMRLEYVEFFGKFFDGGGKEFKPLKTLEKYIWTK